MLKTKNVFTKGLVLDFSPENTKNDVLTHALNATLLTFNGNELSLQNDMGNARVETAFLPEGYIPVGTCEYGGIIYIVSYNPLEDKSQIGCFPSPERNISNEELGLADALLEQANFQQLDEEGKPTGELSNTSQYVLLKNDKLNPGDKFIIYADKSIYEEKIAGLYIDNTLLKNPVLALNIVSIEDSGKIIYLNNSVRQYEVDNYKYHILGENNSNTFGQTKVDIDSYRNILSSGYNVFKSKTSGKLAILAELIMVDSFSVTHRVEKVSYSNKFNVIVSTEVGTEETTEKYNIVPELQYYYLKNSQGTLQMPNVTLFTESGEFNPDFEEVQLSEIYTNLDDTNLDDPPTLNLDDFTFPLPNTYHGQNIGYEPTTEIENELLSSYFIKNKYYRINKNQIVEQGVLKLYYIENFKLYSLETGSEVYIEVSSGELDNKKTYYVQLKTQSYVNAQRDETIRNNSNIELYAISSDLQPAPADKINDNTIEKFVKRRIVTYRKASQSEIEENVELWEKSENVYTLVISPEEGKEYYIKEETEIWLSIGFEINQEDYTGTIYCSSDVDEYLLASEDDKKTYWDTDKYPILKEDPHYGCPIILYYRQEVISYKEASEEEKQLFLNEEISLFLQKNYNYVAPELISEITDLMLFLSPILNIYTPKQYFQPNVNDNWIEGNTSPDLVYDQESSIKLFIQSDEVITNLTNDDGSYSDYILATLTLPQKIVDNNSDLPFVYDYTIVPCMTYGKLSHLAVSNRVDFSNLHDFDNSNFNVWKYYIDDNLLHLTFGAEIFDTFESDKVDGLILEFYDHRGFAGSLEVFDKRSYSGTFTKILSLNTPNVLSKKRIVNGSRDNNNFKRNINIVKEIVEGDKTFKYNNLNITYSDDNGWDIVNDDCGTLYSNVIYGVKPYLRRTIKGSQEFIKKSDMFLFTLPIYNSLYYNVNNFNNLHNPELNLAMTYRLEDNSYYQYASESSAITKDAYDKLTESEQELYFQVYFEDCTGNNQYPTVGLPGDKTDEDSSGDKTDGDSSEIKTCKQQIKYVKNTYTDGYTTNDYEKILKYFAGTYDELSLEVTKYYKYVGTTKLYLEIGLAKEYELFNLTCNPKINDNFSCQLQLVEDDLNNDINFGNSKTKSISSISDYNFISKQTNNPININYTFNVGYTANITNIRIVDIPVTTVCALCHKSSTDELAKYNYEDFGIYEKTLEIKLSENESTLQTHYLSSAAFYNCGTGFKSEFGIAKLEHVQGVSNVAFSFTPCYTTTEVNNLYKSLNVGDALKSVQSYIGKLAFCLPHLHEKDLETGPSIYESSESDLKNIGIPALAIAKDGKKVGNNYTAGISETTGLGIIGKNQLYYWPRATMCLNTYNSINHQSEFVSTLSQPTDGDGAKYISRDISHNDSDAEAYRERVGYKFNGLDPGLLSGFNKYLLETMKGLYAYNPDYATTQVTRGDVNINLDIPTFNTNLVCSLAKLTGAENINNYIAFGGVYIEEYLSDLTEYSSINIEDSLIDTNVKQVTFKANLKKCGESNMLISELSYRTPVPETFLGELNFDGDDLIMLKHHDGTRLFIQGNINKKKLYGYNKEHNKLVEINPTNYTISGTSDPIGTLYVDYTPSLLSGVTAIVPSNVPIQIVKPSVSDINFQEDEVIEESWNPSKITNDNFELSVPSFTEKNPYFIGSTVKLTDLLYEPLELHRLYVKSTTYSVAPNQKIWYRTINDNVPKKDSNNDVVNSDSYKNGFPKDWQYEYYKDNNVLLLYAGPCFKSN